MAETQPTSPQLPRNLMLAISCGQGLALFLLWRALTNEVWPSLTPAINFPLWTFVLIAPTLLLFTLERGNLLRSLEAAGLFSAVMVLLGAWVGWQASPHGAFPIESLLAAYVLSALIACFLGLMFIQRWVGASPRSLRRKAGITPEGERGAGEQSRSNARGLLPGAANSYAALFALSWRNFLVAALAGATTVGVSLILFLSAELFAVIGIEFFRELVRKDWFLLPVLAVAFGLGVAMFRQRVRVIDGITSLLEGLARLLLPLIAAVTVVFLGALPVTGLAPLWETGNGTALLLWLNALALFLVNAAYQSGRNRPYPPLVHSGLCGVIALLPVISLLALYGLYLRIDEYGLTVLRCWAFTVFLMLALFSGGYSLTVVRKRAAWPPHLGQANSVMGWVVLAVMLLVNSPLLDFRSLSLKSQMARLDAKEIALEEFDFHYAKHHLARPGYLVMESLIARVEKTDPGLAAIIRDPVRRMPPKTRFDEVWDRLVYRPEPFETPPGLRETIWRAGPRSPEAYDDFVLIRIDLDTDGEPEYVLSAVQRGPDRVDAWQYARNGGEWNARRLFLRGESPEDADLAHMLRNGDIETVAPRFQHLQVGELQFQDAP